MTASRFVLLFAVLFALVVPAQAQRPIRPPTVSSRGDFAIVQRQKRGGVEQTVEFRNGKTIVLDRRAPWPALYEIAPDDRWIFRQQRLSPGENVGYVYAVDMSNRDVIPAQSTLNDRAIWYLQKKWGFRPDRYFNINVAFFKWDMKKKVLIFEFHASPIRSREEPVDLRLRYNLKTGEITKSKK